MDRSHKKLMANVDFQKAVSSGTSDENVFALRHKLVDQYFAEV